MIKLNGDKSEVLRYLGYKGQQLDSELSGQIDLLIAEGKRLASPRFTYAVYETEKSENEIILKNTNLVLRGSDIFKHLENAKQCAVMAVTVGSKIESAVIRYEKSGEMTKAAVLDCVATALAEETAEYCNNKIIEEAKQNNLFCNYRFSPGYGDLPLETQKELLLLLNSERAIGVTLSDTFLMSPRKSVTAIIGLFEKEQQNEKLTCEICSMKETCEKRKVGENCGI